MPMIIGMQKMLRETIEIAHAVVSLMMTTTYLNGWQLLFVEVGAKDERCAVTVLVLGLFWCKKLLPIPL